MVIGQLSHRLELYTRGMAIVILKLSTLTPEPMKTVFNARLWYSWLRKCFYLQYSAESIEIRHQQLYQLCPGNSKSGSVTLKVFELTNLSSALTFCIHKVFEIDVLCQDKYFILVFFQIVLPNLECFNNGQKLRILGFVAGLSSDHLLKEKIYWMSQVQIVHDSLAEDSIKSIARSFHFNLDVMLRVKII